MKLPEPLVIGQQIVVKYEYPGFTVHIATNYVNGVVSIVEPVPDSYPVLYKDKSWKFVQREIEFLVGWRYIFDCLSDAVKRAEEDLKAFQGAADERRSQKIVDILVAAEKYRTSTNGDK